MARYVLVNRRAGKFTPEAKLASRAAVATTLGLLRDARILADHQPDDALARRVVLLETDPTQVAALRASLPPDAILEPVVVRKLHHHRPVELKAALPMATHHGHPSSTYRATIRGGGKPLPGINVMLYVRDPGGHIRATTLHTNDAGEVDFPLPPGYLISFVEPIPYASFWITLAEAPPSGAAIECLPVAAAHSGGAGWWHDVMRVDVKAAERGKGIKVGVIDTGCGPHPNLKHVRLVGAFVDGHVRNDGADVAEHGTHTTGIIGARPSVPTDYAGMAPECELFHARVFKSEDEGPTQADLIHAIDALSRDHGCDLINMSLGGGPPSVAEEDAIRDAAERGTLCLCSAGNEAGPIDYPGAYAECVAVSAIGKIGWAPAGTFSAGNRPQQHALLGRENLFLAAFSCYGSTLACTAPGVGIVSTVPDRGGVGGLYMEMDGTSMASPAACGALAVILSHDPTYKTLPRDVSRTAAARHLLALHCHPIGLAKEYEGRGLPRV